jgi:hypothetical protein
LKKILAFLKTIRYNGSAWDFPMTLFTPHTRGPVAPVVRFGRAAGMIGVEEKTKGEN